MAEADDLRLRMWRERSSHSRTTGSLLVGLSVALFVVAYLVPLLVVEIASISSFAIGILLLAYESEPRMKLGPASTSLLGPLQVMASIMKKEGYVGSAVYSPEEGGSTVGFSQSSGPLIYADFPSCGHGLYETFEKELGGIKGKGLDHLALWLPRAMVDGLGLARGVKIKHNQGSVTTVLEKPFVRYLCVNEFMTKNICGTTGCPLVASVAESLAFSSGKPVKHALCTYDPVSQTATAKHVVLS